LLFLNGCGTLRYKPDSGTTEDPIIIPCCRKDIKITYLGASGFLIERGDFAVLTAPFFSNPLITSLPIGIEPNTDLIDAGLHDIPLAHVKAILVGHAHYDHLLDVPNVAKRIKAQGGRQPKIYGSKTMRNILLNSRRIQREVEAGREECMNPANIVALNQKAAVSMKPGEWVCFDEEGEIDCGGEDIYFRFMAINSMHAPHFAGLKFFGGTVESPEGPPATTGADWKEGQTFTYLIDFLGPGQSVDLRIHFQDATCTPPAGFIPELKPEDRADRVDVAIVCVAGYGEVQDYPEGIMGNLEPRAVILSHWENFFEPYPYPYPLSPEELKVVPGTNVNRFIERLEKAMPSDACWTLPTPGSHILFNPGARTLESESCH